MKSAAAQQAHVGEPRASARTGGSGSISISTTRDCTWSASADSNWVALATTSGQGEATLAFTVAANPVPSPRSCALLVSSQRVPLSQAAAPCHFDLSRTHDAIGAAGGQLSVNVSTLTGCAWTATSTASWIAVQSGQSGNTSAAVVLSVVANSGEQRAGQVTIAGQAYTVTQDGPQMPGSTPPPGPPAPGPPPPPSTSIQLSGTVESVFGRCPSIGLTLSGRIVGTNADTEFQNLKCTDVKKGVRLTVDGIVLQNDLVLATRIRRSD